MNFSFLFDMPAPQIQAAGAVVGIAFGLFLSAIAIALFLLFRKKLTVKFGILIGSLIVIGIGGGLLIWFATFLIDRKAEQDRKERFQRQYQERTRKQYLEEQEEKNSNKTNTPPSNANSGNSSNH